MTMTRDRFATLDDARTALDGTAPWDWGPRASWGGWCEYAFRHGTETVNEMGEWHWDHDGTLSAYLLSVGVDPADFQLTDAVDLDLVTEMCARELIGRDDDRDAAPSALLRDVTDDDVLDDNTFRWELWSADLIDRDITPGARNVWWVCWDAGTQRGAAMHESMDRAIWTDAASPAEVLARVLTGDERV